MAMTTGVDANAANVVPLSRAPVAPAPWRRAWRALKRWHDRRQAVRELSALSDHQLHDIGVNRADIEQVVAGLHARRTADVVALSAGGAEQRGSVDARAA